MKITVVHVQGEPSPTKTALVETPNALGPDPLNHLEHAFRWTQNTEGSWSMKIGVDANDNVTNLAPFYVDADGKEWGHRSTMVGDLMLVDGQVWAVDGTGFTPC